jgi:hypothetical protein
MMRMMRASILPILFLLLFSCTGQKEAMHHQPCEPLTTEDFLERPFYFDLSIDSLEKTHAEVFELTRFLRKIEERQGRRDTIHRFRHRETTLIFYRSPNGSSSFLTANVGDASLELRNCIRVGMPRVRLEERITDFPSDFRDTVKIHNKQRQAVFIFEKSRLKKVFINNYFR